MDKNKIIIEFNIGSKNNHNEVFEYEYYSNRIKIEMKDKSYVVDFLISNSNSYKRFLDYFNDIIKKLYLIHTIYNSDLLVLEKVSFFLNGTLVHSMIISKDTPYVAAIFKDFKRKIDSSLMSKDIVERILSYSKSKYDNKISALFSYILSKTKSFETERFQYLWISFNGMYNCFNENFRKDRKKMFDYLSAVGVKCEILDKNNNNININKIIHAALGIICKSFNESTDVENCSKKFIIGHCNAVNNLLALNSIDNKFDGYGFIMSEVMYHQRCNLFHGDKPILLFKSLIDDNTELKILNDLLEEFIDEHLYSLFDKDNKGG